MDCSLLGSSVHGIFQARVLEWGVIAFCVTREMQITLVRYHLICMRTWLLTKIQKTASVGEDMKKLEVSQFTGGNVKQYSYFGKQSSSYSKG